MTTGEKAHMEADLYLNEILQQPQALRQSLAHWLDGEPVEARLRESLGAWKPSLVILTGMGSSVNACHACSAFLNGHGRPAVVIEASELLYYYSALCSEDSLVVLVTQSGESVEAVRLLEELGSRSFVISLTNGLENYVAKHSRLALDMRAGKELTVSTKTYTTAHFGLVLLAHMLTGIPPESRRQYFEDAVRLVEAFLDGWEERVQPLVDLLEPCAHISLIGRGPSLSSAMEGALMLKEAAHRPAEGISGGHFRHGPLELVSESYGYILFPGESRTRHLILGLGRDIAGYRAKTAYVGGEKPEGWSDLWVSTGATNDYLSPVVEIVPLQLLAWSLASREGRTIGGFNKISKVIRTE